MRQMSEAVNAISGATQATGASGPHPLEAPGALATALDDFDVSRDEKQIKAQFPLFLMTGWEVNGDQS